MTTYITAKEARVAFYAWLDAKYPRIQLPPIDGQEGVSVLYSDFFVNIPSAYQKNGKPYTAWVFDEWLATTGTKIMGGGWYK